LGFMAATRAEVKTWRAVDAFLALYLLVTALVIVLAGPRAAHGGALVAGNLVGIGLIAVCRRLQLRSSRRALRCLYGALPLALFGYMWMEIDPMQHILYAGWFDPAILHWERAIFGVDVNLFVGRYARPWLTEWMMMGYFSYVPLLPLVMVALCAETGQRAADTYLLGLAMGYAACFLVFVLWPIGGPKEMLHFYSDLNGYLFRWITRRIEEYGHFPGGAFPSPHCCAGTVMLYMAYRCQRRTFWAILPFILTFYAATVYGRYHYVSDTVTGIAVGLAVAWLATRLDAWWERRTGLRQQTSARGGPEGGTAV
jgi:membrane-associated phospholipid phosphatase